MLLGSTQQTGKFRHPRRHPTCPRKIRELRSFWGLLHYYGRFLTNLADHIHPLNQLLQANSKWRWTPACKQAFVKANQLQITAPVLAHYDPMFPLNLVADASTHGIGGVISHVRSDGKELQILLLHLGHWPPVNKTTPKSRGGFWP